QASEAGGNGPPAGGMGGGDRVPIFESGETDWFRRGRHGADRPAARAERGAVRGGGLDLTSGRGLGGRGSGARAGLGWYHRGRAAQARAQGKSCSWRGRRDLSGATSASQVGGTDERASCQLPTGGPRGAGGLARWPDSGW